VRRQLLWRGLLILVTILGSVAAATPPQQKISLGLYLRGGMYLVLQVHTEDAVRAEADGDMARLVQQVKGDTGGKLEIEPQRTGNTRIEVPGLTPEAKDQVVDAAQRLLWRFNHGEQGDSVIFEMLPSNVAELREKLVYQTVEIIGNRIDAYGVIGRVVQAAGSDRIVVQLPGVDDFDRLRKLIQNNAFLEFRLTVYPEEGGRAVTREDILQHFGGRVPADVEILPAKRGDRVTGDPAPLFYAVDKRRTVTGRDLRNARPALGQMDQPILEFSLTPDGGKAFATLTGEHVGSGLAIVLDGQVVSAPVIRSQIRDFGIIEGSFTQKEVEDLATMLRSGALPASITFLEERKVGSLLGRGSIRNRLRAAVVVIIALVVLVVLLHYRLSGAKGRP
jgi:preprotein translocase subunit SecD